MSQSQPQPARQNSKARSCLGCLTVLIFLILACGGGYYGLRWFGNQVTAQREKEKAQKEREKAADPTNARYVKVGDCLVESPRPDIPDYMVIGPCSASGSYKVIKVIDRSTDASDCTSGTHIYEVRDRTKGDDFKVCMTKN
jgi:hypothetical protein